MLSDSFILRGVPDHIRSDNGPEFVARAVQDWIGAVGARTAYIEPGSPWENGYCESFNSKLRDELAIVLRGDLAAILRFAANKKNPTSFRRPGFWVSCFRKNRWLRGLDLIFTCCPSK